MSQSAAPSYQEVHDLTECVCGSPDEPTHVIFDQRSRTLEDALRYMAAEYDADDPTVEEIWARWLDRQEQWELSSDYDHRWAEDHDDQEPPDEVPDGWESDWEYDPVWKSCNGPEPGAVKVWKVATGI